MKTYASKLKNYLDTKGMSMPFLVKAAERLSPYEEMHLTIIVVTELLKVPEDLVRKCAMECLTNDDDILIHTIERVQARQGTRTE